MDAPASQRPSKCTKLVTPAAAAAEAVVTEPALLELLVSFVAQDGDRVGTSTCEAALKTIKSLCLALPTLGRVIGPRNEAFWRDMVLRHFDFSATHEAFNVEDFSDVWGDHVPYEFSAVGGVSDPEVDWRGSVNGEWDDDEEYEFVPTQEGMTPREWADLLHNQSMAVRAKWIHAKSRRKENGVFLEENYSWWPSLGAYFRPRQYAFLETTQADRSLISSEWPAHERAFSLFCDLIVLQKLVRPELDRFQTHSDGEQFLTPCLLGQVDADPMEQRYKMLKHCGFLPPYWSAGRPGVSNRWTGLDGPAPPMEVEGVRNKWRREDERGEHASKEECAVFPRCQTREFLWLRGLAYEWFDDWRRVHVNRGEYSGPEFYIGRSKRSARWIGLIGQSEYESNA